jgi:hypothetical protein
VNLINAEVPRREMVRNLSDEDYFNHAGLSHSAMKRLHPRPAHFLAPEEEEEDKPTAPALALGSLTHTLTLEPGHRLPKIAIRPKGMAFTNAIGKAWRDEQEGMGMTIVTQAEYDAAVGGARNIARHPLANLLLRAGHSEVSYFDVRSTPYGEVAIKGRVDFVPDNSDFLVELKTALDASPAGFSKAAAERRYFAQAVHYLDLHNALCPDDQRNEMIYFAVEKRPPYLVACYRLSPDFVHLGRQAIATDIETFARCTTTGEFEGYDQGPLEISPPHWFAQKQLL